MVNLRIFLSYVIPSVLAFALSGIYAIVDGFFVGNSIGDIGLTTINVAYPVVSLIQALGTGIGMGGAIMYSVKSASNDNKKAYEFINGTLVFLFIVSVVTTSILFSFKVPILRLLGAQGEILSLATQYLRIIILGAIFQVFAMGVVPIIRNKGGSTYAMIIMIIGFLTNIVLDYLFVWINGWGIEGAAIATIIGQGVTALGGFLYLFQKKLPLHGFALSKARMVFKDIIKIGFAPFGITMSPIVSLVFMNRFSIQHGGQQAVAVFACISYGLTIVYLLLQGVGDGSQPLMSQHYGRKEIDKMTKTRQLAYITATILAVGSVGILFFIRHNIGALFGASDSVINDISITLPIFLLSIVFMAFSRITTSSFYATEKSMSSYIIVYSEPIFLFVLLQILPHFYGQVGVWWSMALAQIITSIVALYLKQYADNYKLIKISEV